MNSILSALRSLLRCVVTAVWFVVSSVALAIFFAGCAALLVAFALVSLFQIARSRA